MLDFSQVSFQISLPQGVSSLLIDVHNSSFIRSFIIARFCMIIRRQLSFPRLEKQRITKASVNKKRFLYEEFAFCILTNFYFESFTHI